LNILDLKISHSLIIKVLNILSLALVLINNLRHFVIFNIFLPPIRVRILYWVIKHTDLFNYHWLCESVHLNNVKIAIDAVLFNQNQVCIVKLFKKSVCPIFHRIEVISSHKIPGFYILHVFKVNKN